MWGFIASPHCVWNTCICPLNHTPPSPPQGTICSTPQTPAECLRMCLRLLFRSRSVRPRTTPIRSILRHDERFSAVRSFAASTAALVGSCDTRLRQSPKYFAAANERFHKFCPYPPNSSGISRHEGQALKMILPRNISFHNSFGNTTFPVIAFRRAASCSA